MPATFECELLAQAMASNSAKKEEQQHEMSLQHEYSFNFSAPKKAFLSPLGFDAACYLENDS